MGPPKAGLISLRPDNLLRDDKDGFMIVVLACEGFAVR